ncbi:hypothetical protein jhhlp_006151 [Lomentospora prolificans]|uniref:Uncharacterized protein n=1 Tax=Lomentospora prolificans TaxID=41688 RepID=A0A2N3N542_9PEZI|nr:hypothetical protein jhhlp_006151 [Lomentospora prolificans]
MLSTRPNPPRGDTYTDHPQVNHEALGVPHFDHTSRAWAIASVPGPLLGDSTTRLSFLPQPHLPDFPLTLEPEPTYYISPSLPAPLASRYGPTWFPMATTPFEPTLPGDPFFDIYTDDNLNGHPSALAAAAATATSAPPLPSGQCNFVYVTPGTNGVRCGCRRFWSRTPTHRTVDEALSEDQYNCMCSHHACFHDDATAVHPAPGPIPAPLDNNDASKAGRETLSPLQDISFRFTPGLPAVAEFPGLDAPPRPHTVDNHGHPGLDLSPQTSPSPAPDGSLPDTLCWGDDCQSPSRRITTLPPIPSQCLMPSRPSSVAESSQSRYLRPFAGRGLQTLSSARNPKPRQPLQEKSVASEAGQTQVGKHVNDTSAAVVARQGGAQPVLGPNPSQDLGDTQPFGSYTSPSREALRNITDAVDAHEQRIDRLENPSFSVAGHEDCTEKHDHMDLRVTELESRVEEVEKAMNDSASHSGVRGSRLDTSSSSVASDSTDVTARAIYHSELFSQVQSLQAQVTKMQASLPSFEHPWEVEVVFLPFPLRKIWQEIDEFRTEPHVTVADEWTQFPSTYSAPTSRARSPYGGEWAENHEFEWLLPKACAANGLIDRRLRSRGFIQTISVKGADARSVHVAMNAVFGGLFRGLQGTQSFKRSQKRSVSSRMREFRGLCQDWVPLRKIHKDSRLRFLSPSEMVSASLWDIQFLNSVIMKSSEPRLFITQPEAYIQDIHAFHTGWTWQRLRELPRFYPESSSSREIPEADALEECWAWNEVLDAGPTRSPSSQDHRSKQRVSSSPSQQYYTGIESLVRSSTPTRAPTPGPIRTARKRPQLAQIRTTSMPPSLPPYFSPLQPRRVASSGQEVSPAIRTLEGSGSGAVVKRRQTRSPSRARFTPRWSTKSPSPMVNGPRLRSTTPFNYATPYSSGPGMDAYPTVQPTTRYSHRDAFGLDIDDRDIGDDDDDDDDEHGFDVDIYDEGSSEDYDDEDDENNGSGHLVMVPHLVTDRQQDYYGHQLPEDEPWPGIEDRMSDGENIDPLGPPVDEDGDSQMSSQPSEYPSTQVWNADVVANPTDFDIHEDGNGERTEDDEPNEP